MENFREFQLEMPEMILGGALEPTHVALHGDFYDTERKRYIILLESPQ